MSKTNAQRAWERVDEMRAERNLAAPGYINAKAKPSVTCEGIGVYESIKCVEWYKHKGEKVPKGTPTFAAMEAEGERRRAAHTANPEGASDASD